jgi:5'-3' exonuclease
MILKIRLFHHAKSYMVTILPHRLVFARCPNVVSTIRSMSFKGEDTWDSPLSPSKSLPLRTESTQDDFGGYDYDPSQDEMFQLESNIESKLNLDDVPSTSTWDFITKSDTENFPLNRETDLSTVFTLPASPGVSSNSQYDSTFSEGIQFHSKESETTLKSKVRFDLEPVSGRDDLFMKMSMSSSLNNTIDQLQESLNILMQQIYKLNNGQAFNINSPQQVSMALFGHANESTSKDVLEALDGNEMARLIVQYRQKKKQVTLLERKSTSETKGKKLSSISKVDSASQDVLILIDASAYIFRAYYSMPPLHRRDGMPIGAVLGFCNMLNRLILTRLLSGEQPRIVMVYDHAGESFRHQIYPQYKQNRPSCPIDLIPQFDLIREAAVAYGIPGVESEGFEADDVIATLATHALGEGIDTQILSGDKDLMQLVTAPDAQPFIHMVDPVTMVQIDHDVVLEKWGVPPEQIGDILALAGDTSDNIPGIPGIGVKTAALLLQEFGSLESILENVNTIPQVSRRNKILNNKDLALLSRTLVDLERRIPPEKLISDRVSPTDISNLRAEPLDGDRLLTFYRTMGFNSLLEKIQSRLQRGSSSIRETKSSPPRKSSSWKPRVKANIPKPEDFENLPF